MKGGFGRPFFYRPEFVLAAALGGVGGVVPRRAGDP